MRLSALLTLLPALGLLSAPAAAADEFGLRFSAEAPAALQDPDPDAALAAIAPAAGDEPPAAPPVDAPAPTAGDAAAAPTPPDRQK